MEIMYVNQKVHSFIYFTFPTQAARIAKSLQTAGNGLNGLGLNSQHRPEIFHFSKMSILTPGPTQPTIQ
jgi:hypothetical protein